MSLGPSPVGILLSLLPLVIIMSAWAFYLWRRGGYFDMMRKRTEAFERMADALEKRG